MTAPADRLPIWKQECLAYMVGLALFVGYVAARAQQELIDRREITTIAADHANRDARTDRLQRMVTLTFSQQTGNTGNTGIVKLADRHYAIVQDGKVVSLIVAHSLREALRQIEERKAYERKVGEWRVISPSIPRVVASNRDATAKSASSESASSAMSAAKRIISNSETARSQENHPADRTTARTVTLSQSTHFTTTDIYGAARGNGPRVLHPSQLSGRSGQSTAPIDAPPLVTVRGGAQQEDVNEGRANYKGRLLRTAAQQGDPLAILRNERENGTPRTHLRNTSEPEVGRRDVGGRDLLTIPSLRESTQVSDAFSDSTSDDSKPLVVDSCLPAMPLIVSGDYYKCVEGDAWTLNPENNMPPLKVRAVKEDAWLMSIRVVASDAGASAQAGATISATPVRTRITESSQSLLRPIENVVPLRLPNSAPIYCAVLTSLPLAYLSLGDLVYISNDNTRFWITPNGDPCPPPMNIVMSPCGTFDGTTASMKGCGVTVTPPVDYGQYITDAPYAPDLVPSAGGWIEIACTVRRAPPLLDRADSVSLYANGLWQKTVTVPAGEEYPAFAVALPYDGTIVGGWVFDGVLHYMIELRGASGGGWYHRCQNVQVLNRMVTP